MIILQSSYEIYTAAGLMSRGNLILYVYYFILFLIGEMIK